MGKIIGWLAIVPTLFGLVYVAAMLRWAGGWLWWMFVPPDLNQTNDDHDHRGDE